MFGADNVTFLYCTHLLRVDLLQLFPVEVVAPVAPVVGAQDWPWWPLVNVTRCKPAFDSASWALLSVN